MVSRTPVSSQKLKSSYYFAALLEFLRALQSMAFSCCRLQSTNILKFKPVVRHTSCRVSSFLLNNAGWASQEVFRLFLFVCPTSGVKVYNSLSVPFPPHSSLLPPRGTRHYRARPFHTCRLYNCFCRSVHFGVVPVPNLCVELRGYDPTAVEEASASASASASPTASTSVPMHPSNGEGVATASVTPGHGWHGWREGKPSFLELQRTGGSDGSFVFVTPESGMLLVLAAYPRGGENPVVRVFPDDHVPRGQGATSDQRTARTASGGEVSAFGADSGRVHMHIDLSEGTQAPEVPWLTSASSAADRGKDRSPCARHEATGSLGAAKGDNDEGAASAAGEKASSARQHGGWSRGEELSRLNRGIGGGGDINDPATAAVTKFLLSSRRYFGELVSDLLEASAAACALGRSGLETAGQRVHQSALAASTSAIEWFGTCTSVELSGRLALFSPTTMLTSWHWQRSAPAHSSAWFGEAATQVTSWLEQLRAADLRAWWTVWWVRVGAIAWFLGLLQEVFVFAHKRFKSAARVEVEIAVNDHQCSDSPRRDQDSAGTISTLVGTFRSSDGTVCQLDFGKLGHPEEPATFEKKRVGVLGAAWGRRSGSGTGGSKLADDIGGGSQEQGQEETDEFSSMFRALSQTSCSVTGFKDEIDGGAASNVVVLTQQSW